jgi:hypothetical protein
MAPLSIFESVTRIAEDDDDELDEAGLLWSQPMLPSSPAIPKTERRIQQQQQKND